MASASKYTLSQPIARSETATVYWGQHVHMGREVAIKELNEDLRRVVKRRDRFLRQGDLWANLKHDALLQIYDIDRARGWIIMERMRGSLASDSPSTSRSADELARILKQALEALDYIHKQGQLHCNIKPTNLLIDNDGDVKLSDGCGIRSSG